MFTPTANPSPADTKGPRQTRMKLKFNWNLIFGSIFVCFVLILIVLWLRKRSRTSQPTPSEDVNTSTDLLPARDENGRQRRGVCVMSPRSAEALKAVTHLTHPTSPVVGV